jgi:hypothetical protein
MDEEEQSRLFLSFSALLPFPAALFHWQVGERVAEENTTRHPAAAVMKKNVIKFMMRIILLRALFVHPP